LGRGAIDPGVAARHLGAIAGVRVRTPRLVKLKIGIAFAAGLILGGTGLASAGVLPAPAQDVAHGTLSQVGVSVPKGHGGHGPARYNGPECRGGPYANHGQYVRTHKSDPNAGKSRCGKPVQAGNDEATNSTKAPEAPENDQGDTPAAPGHKAKPQTTTGTAPTVPAPPAPPTSDRAASTTTVKSTGHGHKGKPQTTPGTAPTIPAPLAPPTTTAPAKRATSTTTVKSTTTTSASTSTAPAR
jgi:hypothetical protein